jgi:hypothetical protein
MWWPRKVVYKCEPITMSIIAAAVTHKIIEKIDKNIEEGMDKRSQLEHLLFKIENEKDIEVLRGMRSAYSELCAKYDIYDAVAREHKRRCCYLF